MEAEILAVIFEELQKLFSEIASAFDPVIKMLKAMYKLIAPPFEMVGNIISSVLYPLIYPLLIIARLINKLIKPFRLQASRLIYTGLIKYHEKDYTNAIKLFLAGDLTMMAGVFAVFQISFLNIGDIIENIIISGLIGLAKVFHLPIAPLENARKIINDNYASNMEAMYSFFETKIITFGNNLLIKNGFPELTQAVKVKELSHATYITSFSFSSLRYADALSWLTNRAISKANQIVEEAEEIKRQAEREADSIMSRAKAFAENLINSVAGGVNG